jgi:N6-adenosine-specific RNA methylase IME4
MIGTANKISRPISTSEDHDLALIDAAMQALADAKSPAEFLDIANKAEALRRYVRRARLGMLAQNRCAELRLRAERKLGQFLAITPRLHGRPKSVSYGDTLPRLADLGVPDRRISHRAQRLGDIPTPIFERYLRDAHAAEAEITTRHLLYHCERRAAAGRNTGRIVGGRVEDLIAFAQAGNRMGTLYIDPPWPTENALLPYLPVDLDELRNLPVPMLAAERCHLHMWATANRRLFEAKDIIEGWGFRVVGNFIWVKPEIGRGHYWRQSHEILLTAVRGDADRFDNMGLRSWVEAPRGKHSEKPEIIRAMLERASPAPRLELFARHRVPGWFSWGHEIPDPLTEQQTEKLYLARVEGIE